jgi:hypothetical protein
MCWNLGKKKKKKLSLGECYAPDTASCLGENPSGTVLVVFDQGMIVIITAVTIIFMITHAKLEACKCSPWEPKERPLGVPNLLFLPWKVMMTFIQQSHLQPPVSCFLLKTGLWD